MNDKNLVEETVDDVTVSNANINWKDVGITAVIGAGVIAAGYAGYKIVKKVAGKGIKNPFAKKATEVEVTDAPTETMS